MRMLNSSHILLLLSPKLRTKNKKSWIQRKTSNKMKRFVISKIKKLLDLLKNKKKLNKNLPSKRNKSKTRLEKQKKLKSKLLILLMKILKVKTLSKNLKTESKNLKTKPKLNRIRSRLKNHKSIILITQLKNQEIISKTLKNNLLICSNKLIRKELKPKKKKKP